VINCNLNKRGGRQPPPDPLVSYFMSTMLLGVCLFIIVHCKQQFTHNKIIGFVLRTTGCSYKHCYHLSGLPIAKTLQYLMSCHVFCLNKEIRLLVTLIVVSCLRFSP